MIVPLFTSAKLNETCNRVFPNTRERSSINNQKSLLFVSTPSPWTIIDWNEATILSTEKDYTKRLFAESWLINKSSNVINRNDGNTLPSVYKKLL